MKKILSSVCIATVAMAFAGCSSEDATQDPAPEARKVTLSITADQAGTRTVIGDDNKISWTENDAIEVLEKSDKGIAYAASTGCTLAEGKAGFTVTLPANASSDLIYAAVYPASAFLSENYSDLTKIKAILPATQTPTAASFDPAADLMISQAVRETTQPTEKGLVFSFGRVAALAKMTITGLDLADGETVRQVSFAAAERKLAGRCYLDLANGKVGALGYSNASERIVLDYSAVTGIDKASFPVWFACLPCDLGAGDAFTVVVTSDKNKTYTKNVTLAEAQTLSFTSGRLSTFAVDMTGIAGEETASGARVATLTYEEVGKLGMTYDTPVEYTNAGGTWTIAASKQNSMQINGSKGYIGLPEFTNDISLVRVTTHALSKEATLMLNTSNSTSDAAVSQSQDAESTSFTLVAADAGLKTGYIKSNAVVQITQIEVYTGAAIYLDDLAVSARETTDATTTYRAIAFTANDDTTVSAFDGCVSAASVDPDTKTLTYSVSANTTGAERKGTITLVAAANGAETTVDVSQAADVFKAAPETVTLGGDANAATELTLTSDFEVGTPTVSAPDKFKIEGGAEGKYTVTALADGGAEETELGTITFTRTIDDKQIVVPVKQAAKGDVGAQTLMLTNANIVAGTGPASYGDQTMTDDEGNTWTAYAIRTYHSKATKENYHLQIKAGSQYFIKIPAVSKPIKKIVMTVSNASQPMTGGSNKATLEFRGESASSEVIGSATGTSKVIIDMPDNSFTEGYITATAAVRIWDIELSY